MLIGVIVDELHVDVQCVTVGVGKGPGFTSISPDRRRMRDRRRFWFSWRKSPYWFYHLLD